MFIATRSTWIAAGDLGYFMAFMFWGSSAAFEFFVNVASFTATSPEL